MNNYLFRSARVVLVLAVMLAVPAPQLYAIDSSNRYFAYGLGQRSCEDYVKFREKSSRPWRENTSVTHRRSCTRSSIRSSSTGSLDFSPHTISTSAILMMSWETPIWMI